MKKLVVAALFFNRFILSISPGWLFFILQSAENGHNYRVANIVDIVQWGLGMLYQQAIFENWARGEIEKMSKSVHVYTAC